MHLGAGDRIGVFEHDAERRGVLGDNRAVGNFAFSRPAGTLGNTNDLIRTARAIELLKIAVRGAVSKAGSALSKSGNICGTVTLVVSKEDISGAIRAKVSTAIGGAAGIDIASMLMTIKLETVFEKLRRANARTLFASIFVKII